MTKQNAENDRTSHDYLGWRDGACACLCGRRFDSVQDFTAHVFPPAKPGAEKPA